MAVSKADIKNTYPLPSYNYRVTIVDQSDAPTISFSEVSGLSMEYEAVTYKHGFSFLMGSAIIPGMRQQPVRVTLKKGIVMGSTFLHDWINGTYEKVFSEKSKRDIVIDLCDELGEAVVRWTVQQALPVKLEAPNFNADSNDVAIESMELVAQRVTVNYSP